MFRTYATIIDPDLIFVKGPKVLASGYRTMFDETMSFRLVADVVPAKAGSHRERLHDYPG